MSFVLAFCMVILTASFQPFGAFQQEVPQKKKFVAIHVDGMT